MDQRKKMNIKLKRRDLHLLPNFLLPFYFILCYVTKGRIYDEEVVAKTIGIGMSIIFGMYVIATQEATEKDGNLQIGRRWG